MICHLLPAISKTLSSDFSSALFPIFRFSFLLVAQYGLFSGVVNPSAPLQATSAKSSTPGMPQARCVCGCVIVCTPVHLQCMSELKNICMWNFVCKIFAQLDFCAFGFVVHSAHKYF